MKPEIQMHPVMVKGGVMKHRHNISTDSTKYSTSFFEENKDLRTERAHKNLAHNHENPLQFQNFGNPPQNEYGNYTVQRQSTDSFDEISQEWRTIDEKAHSYFKTYLNHLLDKEHQNHIFMRELQIEKLKVKKKEKEKDRQIEMLQNMVFLKTKEQLSKEKEYEDKIHALTKENRIHSENYERKEKKTNMSKSFIENDQEKIHNQISAYGSSRNFIRSRRAKRFSKHNSLASSPRKSTSFITPFDYQYKNNPSNSTITTPRKSRNEEFTNSQYKDNTPHSSQNTQRRASQLSNRNRE